MFLNVIINLNKEQQRRLRSLEESENVFFVSAEFVCAKREMKDPDLFYSLHYSFVYLWV